MKATSKAAAATKRRRRAGSVRVAKARAAKTKAASGRVLSAKPSPGFTVEREPRIGGRILRARTSSGTPVAVRPMPGFSKCVAFLATRFGSLDERLPDGRALPLGLAHFLEHKMFETPEGDIFDRYAKRGASANAYTTFSHTTYLFTCTSRFEENLDTLLDTLATMHAEEAGIEREKGIIGQEIAMYDDDPGWRGQFNLLRALYRHHPIRHDITGSKETIAPIDRPTLVATHAAYYHPANLSLFVAGDVDPAAVLARAEARLVSRAVGAEHHRAPIVEPLEPASPEVRQALSVHRPQVTLGIKDAGIGARGAALVRRETETELLLDVLYGDGGRVEAPLYREGIVDESFTAGYDADQDYGFVAITAEVDDEEPYRSRLVERTEAAAKTPITAAELERSRRRSLGGYVRTFNSPERVASLMLGLHMKDARLKDAVEALDRVTPADLDERLRTLLACGRAWSIITPRGGVAAPAASE